MEALTKIVDLFLEAWEYIKFWAVVLEYQNGGMMRFGRFHRYLKPGYHWKIPFFEIAEIYNTAVTTIRLPAQTIGGRTVRGTLKYYIKDIKPYITDIYAEENYLRDAAMSCVAHGMQIATGTQETILEAIRKEVNQYGFKILRITLVDDMSAQNYRVILDKDLEELE
ncbi:MAG: SPFH domain-containing protein [Planctomycetota bacterium]|jgi:regulator of protease activity HflC (stomatin/prohibitin superfamily)